jgi:hypothetical protein
MNCMKWSGVLLTLIAGVTLLGAGCGKGGKDAKDSKQDAKAPAEHGEWWCEEHGVPEDVCTLCHSKLAKEAKARGDWCKEHNRAKSICFKCDPKLKEKYAMLYREKYNKEPPPITRPND